jgi:hypothetical protein
MTMRFRVRRVLAAAAAVAVMIVGLPAAAAFSDGGRSCNNELPAGTPAYVQCVWLNTPEEAADVAMFWLGNDSANLKAAGPVSGLWFACDNGDACIPADAEGDGGAHGDGDPAPDGYTEPTAPPTCEPPGTECYVDPSAVTPQEVAAAAQTPAGEAVAAAAADGLRVWVETELADDWKAGDEAFKSAVRQAGALAAQPGVAGIRFTSQLGYNGTLTTPADVQKFVTDASTALRKAAPGKKLGVHTVVPEFGCGADDTCKKAMGEKYPLLAPASVESYLKSGAVDQLTLDNGLLAGAYGTWKITPEQAQGNQWVQVRARAWDALTQIAAEDAAFAAPTPLTAAQAATLANDRVAVPLKDGASTVNLWTRWQDDKGKIHQVLGPALAATPAWTQLTKLSPLQRRLSTIYDPASPEVGVTQDLKKLAEVFSQVYVTA